MIETLLGGLMGGVFRVVPEALKWMDRKNERAHELAMQDRQIAFEQLRGQQKMAEIGAGADADWNTGAIEALKESIAGQGKASGVRWIDGLSTLMRPLITLQWVVVLYPAVLVASFTLAVNAGVAPLVALVQVFGPSEKAICSGILNFWFLGRVFDRVR